MHAKYCSSSLVNSCGEFRNSRMEGLYRRRMKERNLAQLKTSLRCTAALFLMIGLFDYLLLGPTKSFFLLLAMRLVVATSFVLLAEALTRYPKLIYSACPLNAALLLLATSLILVVPLRPETVNIQISAVLATTLAMYLFIPNRIPCSLAASSYMAIGFVFAISFSEVYGPAGLVGTTLILILANVVGAMTALRLNCLQREQFSSLLAERSANKQLKQEIRTRQKLEDELRRLAHTDHLTGLYNRRGFAELLQRELKNHRRSGAPLGLCMLDLDHFKRINDSMGHAAGDKLLITVAALLNQRLRETDVIGRIGGEEFMIALPNSNAQDTYLIAEQLRCTIEQYRFSRELSDVMLTVSIGTTQIDPISDTLESATARADKALYRGKNGGRNAVVAYESPFVPPSPSTKAEL